MSKTIFYFSWESKVKIRPYIVGRGGAAMAMQKSVGIVSLLRPQLQILPFIHLERGQPLEGVISKTATSEVPVLFIANPHGLHTKYILDGERAGFKFMVAEKPICVSREELEKLRYVKSTISVCHGYRQMWGPQYIEKLIRDGAFGKIVSIEGRYWQSSAAQSALSHVVKTSDWKNDPTLGGSFDTLIDLGSHWADLMFFFAGENPFETKTWVSHINAPAPHRDTHVHLTLNFKSIGHTFGSVSKTVHGAGNELNFTVVGEKQSATWSFEVPDRITIGSGNKTTAISRERTDQVGSFQAPYHGLGWLEGYVEIIAQTLVLASGKTAKSFPTLAESLNVM